MRRLSLRVNVFPVLLIVFFNTIPVVDAFHVTTIKHELWLSSSTTLKKSSPLLRSDVALYSSFFEDETSSITGPNPILSAQEVTTLCMEALKSQKSTESLSLCFEFCSDRCRAAVGGTLDEFVQYAANPIFGLLIGCDNYQILNVGPVIPGGPQRGEMQTILIEIQRGVTVRDAVEAGKKNARKRPTLEERLKERERKAAGISEQQQQQQAEDDGKIKFLWTLQKERRPPRQGCWLINEVLYTKNACYQTE